MPTSGSDTQDATPSVDDSTLDGARLRARADAPQLPPRYRQLDKLGEGGMGIVHAALDTWLDRKVAIKWVHAASSGEIALRRRARLIREARAIAALAHPNVVAVFDVGEADGDVWVAMELIEGVDLRLWLAAAPRDWREVLDVFVQAGLGLAAAHAAGLVHRDFKPANVMLGDDGRVRVLDFGLARASVTSEPSIDVDPSVSDPDDAASLTGTGQRVGTPAYMSPEQHTGDEADAASDQFAFCVALHEALFGERPFAGDTAPAIAFAVIGDHRRPVPRDRAVPAWLHRVLRRGTAHRPGDRFASMRALLDRIASHRRRRAWARVIVASAALGLAAWAWWPAAPSCPELDVDGLWAAARREQLRATFEAAGIEQGPTRFAELADDIDVRVEALVVARGRACLPTRDEPAIACLVERVAALRAFLDLLATGEPATLELAGVALAAMPASDTCLDRAARAPTPSDAQTIARVAELRTRIAQVRAASMLGLHARALADARAIVTDADAVGFAPLRAEALVVLGDALQHDHDPAEAELVLRDALWLAESEGYDAVLVEAVTELAWLRLEAGAPDDEIDRLLASGYAAARRARDLDHFLPVLLNLDAEQALQHGDVDEALARWQEALAWTLARGTLADPDLPSVLHNVGNARLLRGEPELAAWCYAQALELTVRYLGAAHPSTYAERQSLADALSMLGREREALPIYEEVLAFRTRALEAKDPRLASTRANYGAALRAVGRFADAIDQLERALALKRELGAAPVSLARTLGELAQAHDGAGDVAQALVAIDEALALLDGAADAPAHELRAPLRELAALLERNVVTGADARTRIATGTRLAARSEDDELAARFAALR